jgi:hypothetical protein
MHRSFVRPHVQSITEHIATYQGIFYEYETTACHPIFHLIAITGNFSEYDVGLSKHGQHSGNFFVVSRHPLRYSLGNRCAALVDHLPACLPKRLSLIAPSSRCAQTLSEAAEELCT